MSPRTAPGLRPEIKQLIEALAKDMIAREDRREKEHRAMHIRKFVEALDYGRVSNRVGYAADLAALPEPTKGAEWREDTSFREAEAVAGDADFARVIEHARKHGFATVSRNV